MFHQRNHTVSCWHTLFLKTQLPPTGFIHLATLYIYITTIIVIVIIIISSLYTPHLLLVFAHLWLNCWVNPVGCLLATSFWSPKHFCFALSHCFWFNLHDPILQLVGVVSCLWTPQFCFNNSHCWFDPDFSCFKNQHLEAPPSVFFVI